jgi:hypothetical protein
MECWKRSTVQKSTADKRRRGGSERKTADDDVMLYCIELRKKREQVFPTKASKPLQRRVL